jgi:hypothetical protein
MTEIAYTRDIKSTTQKMNSPGKYISYAVYFHVSKTQYNTDML